MLSKYKKNFEGIYVATICPMNFDGSINVEGLTDHFKNKNDFTFCDYPYICKPEFKVEFLEFESKIE